MHPIKKPHTEDVLRPETKETHNKCAETFTETLSVLLWMGALSAVIVILSAAIGYLVGSLLVL